VPISELFPPRGMFGLYAQQRLAEAKALSTSTVEHVRAEVVDLQVDPASTLLTLDNGQQLRGAQAVLATGMFPAARTPQTESSGLNAAAVDPWDVQAMSQLEPRATVLIIGSGLTWSMPWCPWNRLGTGARSRCSRAHGLLPHVRRQPPGWDDFLAADHRLRSPRQLLREVQSAVRIATAQGIGLAGAAGHRARAYRPFVEPGQRAREAPVRAACGRGGKVITTVRRR